MRLVLHSNVFSITVFTNQYVCVCVGGLVGVWGGGGGVLLWVVMRMCTVRMVQSVASA